MCLMWYSLVLQLKFFFLFFWGQKGKQADKKQTQKDYVRLIFLLQVVSFKSFECDVTDEWMPDLHA